MEKFGFEAEAFSARPMEEPIENSAERREFRPGEALEREADVLKKYGKKAAPFVAASMLALASVMGAGGAMAAEGEPKETASVSDVQENLGYGGQEEAYPDRGGDSSAAEQDREVKESGQADKQESKGFDGSVRVGGLTINLPSVFVGIGFGSSGGAYRNPITERGYYPRPIPSPYNQRNNHHHGHHHHHH